MRVLSGILLKVFLRLLLAVDLVLTLGLAGNPSSSSDRPTLGRTKLYLKLARRCRYCGSWDFTESKSTVRAAFSDRENELGE